VKFIPHRSDNNTQTLRTALTQHAKRELVSPKRNAKAELDRVGDVGRGANARFFDNKRAFVLDIKKISPIIYIWYEGGWLSPPVVTVEKAVGG
jgi:hypothetical protein